MTIMVMMMISTNEYRYFKHYKYDDEEASKRQEQEMNKIKGEIE